MVLRWQKKKKRHHLKETGVNREETSGSIGAGRDGASAPVAALGPQGSNLTRVSRRSR